MLGLVAQANDAAAGTIRIAQLQRAGTEIATTPISTYDGTVQHERATVSGLLRARSARLAADRADDRSSGDLTRRAVVFVAAESATSALGAFPKALEGGPANVDVYLGVRDGKSVYAGISNNIDRRALQHGDRFDQLRQVTTTPVTRGQARSIEQALISRNPDSRTRSTASARNEPYQQAVDWGNAWLDANGYP